MDQRRAAGALLALAVCIASTAAAPTVSNQTGLDLYDGSPEGCYYNFQHYGEGDRIMTNEPCLNCTCHNRMLMCYLRVCPFTKPIGQDCTVEKRADQCCPIVTCPDVPVDLLTSTSTTSPAEYGATGVGKLDKYGCSINGKYFPEGSKVPPTPNKPCEHCYCIRNMTTCVMQECTLHVDGCTPIYHKDVCCPVRYSCDHPEDSTLLLDDMTTTVRPTPGFLLTTTTLSPVTQMSQDCVHDDQIFPDGALIKTEKACEHCYCMKGDIVCVVQECGYPMENEGKNCTSQPPREGQCCPDTYICEEDEMITELPSEFSTQSPEVTTLSPPRRVGVEGSGYRNEPDEPAYTEVPSMETEPEGSGYEQSTETAAVDDSNVLTSETPEISSEPIDESLYPSRTTLRTPTLEEVEKTTEPDKGLNTVPSDAGDEEMYKPLMTEKTPFEEPKVTETTLISDEKPGDVKDKTTSPEDVFMPAVTTKFEESSSTTESAFRKEDTVGEPTEIYDQGEPEKVTTEATDIEKETEEDFTSSKTKAPFMEELEKQTTLAPEITEKDIEHGIPSKESTTEPVLEVTTSADVKITDKIMTDSVDLGQIETTRPTVEEVEVPEGTSSGQNEVEDISTTLPPSRIPGEGDCLLNDITYRNNSNVPSTNNCHTSCRCVSSIVKCDPIICSPPPEYMDNCQPTYDSPDACCPTYVCHTGETMPPQPHSQMSGTDSPLPSSPIECHGDECEVRKDDNVPVVGDCGSAGCGQSGIPETPSEECHDGKCSLPAQPCIGGNCQETPAAHCENGKCGTESEIVPVKDIPLCDNKSDCKEAIPEVPSCEGEECVNVNVECSGTDCKTNVVQPEMPTTHCENGKCGIEPEIVPDKNIPLCENESDCKGTVPEVPSCEGEGCVSDNVGCSGTDCSTDINKQPTTPEKDEGSCEEPSCIRKETGQVDSSLPSECSGSDCIQQVPSKEDEMNKPSTTLPVTEEDIGTKSTQQLELTTVKYEIQTESPESQTKASEDANEYKPTEMVDLAMEEGSTRSPLSQTTEVSEPLEDKISETEPSSQFDHTTESKVDKEDTVTKSPHTVEEDLSTSEPQISVTDETRISDTDVITKEPQESATKIQEPVTESQDVSTKLDSEEAHQTGTTQHTVHESTESPHGTELHDIRTAVPPEPSTSSPEKEGTKAPEQDQTESSIPQEPDQADVTKVAEEPVPYTPEIEIASTKLPELDVKQDVTESHATEVTDVSSHEVTESNEIVDKITKLPEFTNTDEYKMTSEMFQHELTTEGATLVTASQEPERDVAPTTYSEKEIEQAPFTNAPTESHLDDRTSVTDSFTEKISETSTAKVSEDTLDVTSGIPEIYKTEKQEPFTESPGEYITESQESITKQSVLPGQEPVQTESPEFTTDETMSEPEVSTSEEDNKPLTTSATPVKDAKLPFDTKIIEEGTTQASESEEKTTISAPVEKPEVYDENKKQPAETPDTNDVEQEPSEKPATTSSLPEDEHTEELDSKVTISDKTVTDSSDTFVTEKPSKTPGDDYKTDEEITDSGQGITEQQEISTEEPSEPESPVTDKIPSEPYIPVHPGTTPELATAQPDFINEIPDEERETQTPEVEIETKIPERSGSNEATDIPERMETKSPEVKEPETATEVSYTAATQQPEIYSETPVVEEIHKDEQPQSTEKPTKDTSDDLDTKEETKAPEAFITEMPATEVVPEKTQAPEVFVTEQQEKDSVTTESAKEQPAEGDQEQTRTSEPDKYSTVSVIQETTVPSVESEVTERDTPYVTSAPESHVKEPVKPVTETAETFTTVSDKMGVSVPQEKISPDEAVTEGLQEVSSSAPEGKPIQETSDIHDDEKPKDKPHLPQDAYTQTPEEETSTVLLEVATEPTQEVIPVKPQESDLEDKDTEKPNKEESSVSQSPDITSTLPSVESDSVVTEPEDKVIEAHVDKATTAISPDEQEKISTQGLQETMTTVYEESPEQPQESSTRLPQEITSTPHDSELPEKYTTAASQETTPGALPDIVTDTPEKEETGSPQVASTEKPSELEDVEMQLTTSKTPQTVDTETSPEQITEGHKQTTEEPNVYETQKPDITKQESITDSPISPTEESTYDEHTTPDVVELEEHSHKPVEETSTATPAENEIIPDLTEKHDEAQQKPEAVTTEKQEAVTETDEEKISIPSDEISPEISTAATMDLGEIPHKSTLPPLSEESEIHPDSPTTSQPDSQVGDNRIGEDATQEEQKPSQASPEGEESPITDTEIPVQTERVPSEKVTESELSHETTMLEETIPVTTKATKEEEESSTQKPEYGEPEETPLEEKPNEKPQDELTEKPSEELTEKPLEATTEKPIEEPEEKPLEETKPSEKPAEESEAKPLEEVEENPTETPLVEPLKTTEIPLDEDKLVKPLDRTTTEIPEQKPLEEETPTEAPQEKPLEGTDRPTEAPMEGSDQIPEEKPTVGADEKLAEKPEEPPVVESEEKSTEKPVDIPITEPVEQPEEKPYEVPEEKPEEMPEDKPLKTPEEKPQEIPEEKPIEVPVEKPEVPEENPQELPEEKPELPKEKPIEVPVEKPEVPEEKPELHEEKPQEVPEEKPQEKPDEKPQEVPEEKPQEVPEEKPQEAPEEKPQEVPDKKPEAPEEKPQEVPEEKPQEEPEEKLQIPEEKPQEVPEEKPQEVPEEKPQEMPEKKPQEVPEEKPQEMPEEKPQEVPEEKPQEMPEEKPQEMPEEKPQEVPEEKPQEMPEEKPQEAPEDKPEVPEEKPHEMPEEKPQEAPEQRPQDVPEEKPTEPASTASPEISKPGFGDIQPTDEVPDDDSQFPPSGGTSGYGTEPDYVEEDQAFGPGTCRYGGKVYVSAQQIPRDDPCDFCFCFRSDIICLQQSCPPPIHGCHEEPIQGFCCPRYECPVAMATTLNVTTTTTTTTTTLPPHFLPHAYKGAAQRRGCQIKGHTYKVGEVVRASSGPCLHCTCGGDGQMKCDPKACTPEPMLRQMIAAAVSAKRRR